MVDLDASVADPPVLRLVGLSEGSGAGVHTALVALGDEPRIILDLSEVSYADRGALNRLMGAIRRVSRHGRVIAVVCRGRVARALEAAGAGGRVLIAASVADARVLLGVTAG